MASADEDAVRRSLMRLTVRELRQVARDEGVCLGYEGSTKAGIVGAIVSHRRYVEHMRQEESE